MLDAVIEYMPRRRISRRCRVPTTMKARRAQGIRRREILGARVQDHDRPVRRPVDLLPCVFGRCAIGRHNLQPCQGKRERIGRLLQMHANEREEIKEVRAGDIAAAVGLKEATTGDTLCDPASIITLERMVFPEPVISQAVEPKTEGRPGKDGYRAEPFGTGRSVVPCPHGRRVGQTIIAGMGELHLEIIVDRMKREFGVEASVGKPQVAYRETIRKGSEIEGKFVKQSGGRGQYGHVWLKLEPNEPGKGFEVRRRHQGRWWFP